MESLQPKKVIWGKIDIHEAMLQPYIVNTDLEAMKAACELCKTESCCPEHCCDVSSNHPPLFSGTAATAIIAEVAGTNLTPGLLEQHQLIVGLSTQKRGPMCM